MSGHGETIRRRLSVSTPNRWREESLVALDELLAEHQRLETNWAAEVKLRKALGNQAFQLKAENKRLREALDAADWLITNLRILNEGGVVRGFAEASAGYESAREALAGDTECVCGEINTRHCPVHGQGEALAGDTE